MFDGEAFGHEIVLAVKAHVATVVAGVQAQIDQIRTEFKVLPQPEVPDMSAPPDMIDEISKAIVLLAELPGLQQVAQQPVVVNFPTAAARPKAKTITTSRDEQGNLVAKVVED